MQNFSALLCIHFYNVVHSISASPQMQHPWLTLVALEEILPDVNTALLTMPTTTITETNELVYATLTVVLDILGY